MKRKILAVVLTLAMVVCYMPTMAFAAEYTPGQNNHPTSGCDCQVEVTHSGGSTTHFDTLVSALKATSDNWTNIKLLKKGGIRISVNLSDNWINYSTDIPLGTVPASSKAIYFGSVSDAWTYGKGATSTETIKDLNITGSDYEAELTFASSSKSNIHFATVEGAFAAVKDLPAGTDSTITLVKNADVETEIVVEAGDKVTLDLNGKTLTSKVATSGTLFTVAGEFTVNGAENGSKVTFADINPGGDPAYSAVNFDVTGKLKIESGSFETQSNTFIESDAQVTVTGGTITYKGVSSTAIGINALGGKVIIGENGKTTGPTITHFVIDGDNSDRAVYIKGSGTVADIYGGTFTGNGTAVQADNQATANIYGGTFTTNGLAAKSTSKSHLNIRGGSFASSGSADLSKDSDAYIDIFGGTFKYQPLGIWMADYYDTKESGGKYIVCDQVTLTVTMPDKIYDGVAAEPVVTATYVNPAKASTAITNAVYNYTWAEKDKTGTIEKPSKVGKYTLVVALSSSDARYIAESLKSVEFEIKAQQLFLTAEDKTVRLGDAAPTFTFKAALQSDGTVFTTTEPTYKAFVDSLNNTNIELKDSEGEAITLENALKAVGEYKIYVKATVPTGVDANYDFLLNKKYNATVAGSQEECYGTLKVDPRAPEKYGFDLGESTSTDNVVALAEGVITEDNIKDLTTGTSGVDLVLDATLIDPDAESVQVPMEQAKALYDYMNVASTKDKVLGLTLIFAGGKINLNKTALNNIYTNAGTTADYIEVSAEVIDAADVNKNNTLKGYLEDVEGVNKVLDLNINSMKTKTGTETADSVVKAFDSLGGGKATVTTPLKTADNKKGSDYSVYYIDTTEDEVALTDMEADFTKAANTQTPAPAYEEGTLGFETNHFSYYVVCETIKSKECDGKADCPSYNFLDLEICDDPGVWYHPYIDYVVENKIMNGMNSYTFEPKGVVTRAMVVKMIYEMKGQPSNYGPPTPFSDIDAEQWYFKALKWAYNNDVIKGIDDTHFGPNQPVTREQLATILYRYYTDVLGKTAEKATTAEMNKFADIAKVSAYAEDAMKWAVKSGIIGGEQSGTNLNLKPGDGTLRHEIAKMITVFDRDIIKAKKN